MHFKDLVSIQEHLLTKYDTGPIAEAVRQLGEKLREVGEDEYNSNEEFKLEVRSLIEDLNRIHTNLRFNQDRYNDILERIDRRINQESQKFYTDNYDLELKVESEAVENIRKIRVITMSPETKEEIGYRLGAYANWQFPTLEIGCRDGEWTSYLTASDPLYITDHYREFLESTPKQFPLEYQQRLRVYLTKGSDLSIFPQGQFGFVFCWNFLNYRSLDTIKEYLKSVKDLLRPGGTFMFSYNNGEIPQSAAYVESHWMTYIPKKMLVALCESLGYRVTATRDIKDDTVISWIEVQKPGKLTSIKRQQVLGEIKTIDH